MAGAVYWIGQDGNIYLKGAAGVTGVQNLGQAPSTMGIDNSANSGYGITDSQINLPGANYQATRIADPGSGATPAPGNPTGSSTPALDTAAIANTQGSIDQLPAILQAALESEDNSFANTNSAFDTQEQAQRGAYGKSSDTNQMNYDANLMDAVRAGVKGFHGLLQLLRGSGAEGGTAEDQVKQIVGDTTNSDIRTGADTRNTNQDQLDSTLSSFLTELGGKRQAAKDTHTNNAAAIRRDSNTGLQDLYSKMAGFYGQANDTADANSWLEKAGALTPSIAADSKAVTSRYDTAPVVIHAPNLTAFAPPSQPAVATAPDDGQVGAGIFTLAPTNTKKADQTQVPALAGA